MMEIMMVMEVILGWVSNFYMNLPCESEQVEKIISSTT